MEDKYIHVKAVQPSKATNKNGELPIMCRVTYERKKYFKALGYKARPEHFSEENLLDSKVPNFEAKNRAIKKALLEVEKNLHYAREAGALNTAKIRQILSGKETGVDELTLNDLLLKVQREYIDSLSEVTLGGFQSVVNKVTTFNKGPILISEITPQFLNRFEGYLKKKIGNKGKIGQADTTTWSDMKELRSIFNKGRKIKAITQYPFAEYSVPKYVQPKRNYLILKEVNRIEEYADSESKPAPLRKAAAWFVFSCYSGLRYGDMQVFDESTWIKGHKLYYADEKESTPHFIPLHPKLKKAVERIREHSPVMENQPFNRYLKELMTVCEIETKLTVHLARHTFAVLWLDMGGSKEVLQRLMGHKRMATTEIYGQITNKRIEEEANKVFSELK